MQKYKNLGGNSNVESYEIGDDYITVKFGSGSHYMYTYDVTGVSAVEQMKILAKAGQGLGGMLATKPYHKHAKKW